MILELLQRIVFLTSGTATFVWALASTVDAAAIYPAVAALSIASASFLLTPNFIPASIPANPAHLASRKKGSSTKPEVSEFQFSETIVVLILWTIASISLAYTVWRTNITLEDFGFFSTRALLLCWLCIVPLFLPRISHRVRRIESPKSKIANTSNDPP